ncbi:MAG: hypothetical protein PHQ04_01895 [Opitutaceae bacterium]|nr:hypothetical protein [Opitutaceae bacterium]
MIPSPRLLLCLGTIATLGVIGGSATPISSEKLAQTRAKIDTLYRNRLRPPPSPAAHTDPFRIGEAVDSTTRDAPPSADSSAITSEAIPVSDSVILQHVADGLRINGLVKIGGRLHVVLNESTYKEGDILSARYQGSPVLLRVRRITPTQVTLALNAAETSLHLQPVINR